MRIIFVRHSLAGKPDRQEYPDDEDRPLTDTGKEKFEKAADGLSEKIQPRPDRMYSSPNKRVWQTAKILHERAGWPAPEASSSLEGGTPIQGTLDLIEAARKVGHGTIAIVGHNGHLKSVMSHLLTGDQNGMNIKLNRGAAASVDYSNDPAQTRLRWIMSRKSLARQD